MLPPKIGLQAEIQAAYKECECVRMKLKLQEEALLGMRAKMNESEDAHIARYSKINPILMKFREQTKNATESQDNKLICCSFADDLEMRYSEQQDKLEQMQKLAIGLQVQLAEAQCDAADMRAVRDRLVKEFDEERQALQDALDGAIIDRAEIEVHWQREYELLRTVNAGAFESIVIR